MNNSTIKEARKRHRAASTIIAFRALTTPEGIPPTVRELALDLGCAHSHAHRRLLECAAAGLLIHYPGRRPAFVLPVADHG